MKRLLFFLIPFIITSCVVSSEEFYSLQRQVIQLQSEFKASKSEIYTETDEIKSTTERLNDLHKNLRKSFADTNTRIDELEIKLNKTRGDIDNITTDISSLKQNVTNISANLNTLYLSLNKDIMAIKSDLKNIKEGYNITFSNLSTLYQEVRFLSKMSQQPKTYNLEEKEKIYNEGLDNYNKNKFNEAILIFERFITLYPQDTLIPNALYWIGESYYAQKKFNEALSYFHRIVIDYPNSKKVPSALLKEIFCLEELSMEKEANGAKEELMVRFPFSEEVKILKEREKNKKRKK